jgi:hypothetical protein
MNRSSARILILFRRLPRIAFLAPEMALASTIVALGRGDVLGRAIRVPGAPD